MSRLQPQPADPLGNQAPFWQPIGKLVFAYGHLEQQIDRCISVLLHANREREGPSVASQIRNLCSRIALLEALFRLLTADKARQAELHSIIKQLRALIKFRNGLLHGPWGSYSANKEIWQKPRTDPDSLHPRTFEVSVEDIKEHTRLAVHIGAALFDLVRQVAQENVRVDERQSGNILPSARHRTAAS